ncbi:hypothetical protein [Paenibacillus sp. USHLN196]|uniref:hypothetical protein n=1 Tax=Paenibacillus sp. USHLN196 TaxID=3081291 RepID=UPI003017C959
METIKDCMNKGLKEILIEGEKYFQDTDEYGNDILKTFDEKDKMWIELKFSRLDMGVEQRLTSMLSNEYLEQQMNMV